MLVPFEFDSPRGRYLSFGINLYNRKSYNERTVFFFTNIRLKTKLDRVRETTYHLSEYDEPMTNVVRY